MIDMAAYPERLSNHLRELSEEQEDDMWMYMEWDIQGTEYTEIASGSCPCGKQGIRNICYIKNKHTNKSTYVGTTCMALFDEQMKEVLQFVLGLINMEIRGQYKGTSYHENTDTTKYRFEIEEDASLAKKREFLASQVEFVPVYKKTMPLENKKWEMKVFFEISPIPDLQEGRFYHLRMKGSRWEKEYGTGITFRVIECSEDDEMDE